MYQRYRVYMTHLMRQLYPSQWTRFQHCKKNKRWKKWSPEQSYMWLGYKKNTSRTESHFESNRCQLDRECMY